MEFFVNFKNFASALLTETKNKHKFILEMWRKKYGLEFVDHPVLVHSVFHLWKSSTCEYTHSIYMFNKACTKVNQNPLPSTFFSLPK